MRVSPIHAPEGETPNPALCGVIGQANPTVVEEAGESGRSEPHLKRLAASDRTRRTRASALKIEKLPSEAQPLACTVNGALDRLNEAYASQKRFTADAAHAFRTPVAVMSLRLQRGVATGALNVAALRGDLKEIARMIAGLLNLANAEPSPAIQRER